MARDIEAKPITLEIPAIDRIALYSPTSTGLYRVSTFHQTTIDTPLRALLKTAPMGYSLEGLATSYVLLIVNISNQPINAVIQFERAITGASVVFENRSMMTPLDAFRGRFGRSRRAAASSKRRFARTNI